MTRVLHVLGALNRGGIEVWLVQVLRALDREAVHMDFYCLGGEAGVLAPDVRALGSRVHVGDLRAGRRRLRRDLSRVLRSGGYDVVHSHVHHFSGYVLRIAAQNGVPGRIAQSLTAPREQRTAPARRAYVALMSRWIDRYATLGLGVSTEAMVSLFGPDWMGRPDRRLLYSGIDLERFRESPPEDLRARLGIPQGAAVVGHVGRFDVMKNHGFILDVAEALERSGARVWFVFVGDGPLRSHLEERVRRAGTPRVVFAGEVDEVAPFLQIMNLFLFPSLWEGLPQSVIEAQAAGVRCLCSDVITGEVAVLPDAVRFESPERPPEAWAETLLAMLEQPPLDREDARARVASSPFAITTSVDALTQVYRSAAGP